MNVDPEIRGPKAVCSIGCCDGLPSEEDRSPGGVSAPVVCASPYVPPNDLDALAPDFSLADMGDGGRHQSSNSSGPLHDDDRAGGRESE